MSSFEYSVRKKTRDGCLLLCSFLFRDRMTTKSLVFHRANSLTKDFLYLSLGSGGK